LKPLCAWNLERTASTCRERCGGAGYLSCSRFGSLIGFSHAGITAEGDNRVLFQKAAKELLASLNTQIIRSRFEEADRYTPINASAIVENDLDALRGVFVAREVKLLRALQKVMAGAGNAPPEIFDAWMHRESDTVQATTQAYGEREVLDACMRAIQEASPALRELLTPIVQVRF
jgi:acyl-CoA oxidase